MIIYNCYNQSIESTVKRRPKLLTLLRIFVRLENCCFVYYNLLPTTTSTTTTIFSAHIVTIYIGLSHRYPGNCGKIYAM